MQIRGVWQWSFPFKLGKFAFDWTKRIWLAKRNLNAWNPDNILFGSGRICLEKDLGKDWEPDLVGDKGFWLEKGFDHFRTRLGHRFVGVWNPPLRQSAWNHRETSVSAREAHRFLGIQDPLSGLVLLGNLGCPWKSFYLGPARFDWKKNPIAKKEPLVEINGPPPPPPPTLE